MAWLARQPLIEFPDLATERERPQAKGEVFLGM
jgi:hypothetical protein